MTAPSLSSLPHARFMAECLCVGSMGGSKLAVIMALVLSVTGHLRGRRSSAGCGGRRCCRNVLRELASFVSDRPTQLQLRVFIYTKTAAKSHIHQKVPANCCTWPVTRRPVRRRSRNTWYQGRPQQHQITIIYLGRPYSSSITNTYLPYFRYYTRINYIAVWLHALSAVRMRANARGYKMQKKHPTLASPCLRRGTL